MATFNVTISNIGVGNTSRNSGVQLNIDEIYFQRTLMGGLDSGKSTVIAIPNTWTAVFGVHRISAMADSTNTIKQENEINNNMSVDLSVNDAHPPVLLSIEPANGSITGSAPNVTVLLSDGTGSGIDLNSSNLFIKLGSNIVTGTKSIVGKNLLFIPNTPFGDGDYTALITGVDNSGNSILITSMFTVDTQSPVIIITGVSENAKYETPVTPGVNVTDTHLLSTSLTVNGQQYLNGTTIYTDGNYVLVSRAIDKAGNQAQTAISFIVDVRPSKPTGLSINRASTTADLYWNANIETDIAGYNVYRNDIKLNNAPIPNTEYFDNNLTTSTSYIYNITAVDLAGHESDQTGISPIRITLGEYGTLTNNNYYLTTGFADLINASISNDDASQLNIRSVTIEVMDRFGNVTHIASEGSLSIAPAGVYSLSKQVLINNGTNRIALRVSLVDGTQISRVFDVNVRDMPAQPIEVQSPVLLEGYREAIDVKFTNYGSASLSINPQELILYLKDANGSIISKGRGEGEWMSIAPNSSSSIFAFVNIPVAQGDIELINLRLDAAFPTYYGEQIGQHNGTTFNVSKNISSRYQTILPIEVYHAPLIKGSVTQFNAIFSNQGTGDLTVDKGNVTINIKDMNGSILSSGKYQGPNAWVIHDGSGKLPVDVLVPVNASETVEVEVELTASYWTLDGSASPIRFNMSVYASTVKPDYNANARTDKAVYNRGENVTITGKATYDNGTTVPNASINLRISGKGFARSVELNTDLNGDYTYIFKPLDNEAGKYVVTSTHPSVREMENDAEFEILGLYIAPQRIILDMSPNAQVNFTANVENIGESNLTNILIEIVDNTLGDGVGATTGSGTFDLLPKEKKSIDINVAAGLNTPDNATLIIRATSDQGSIADSTLIVNLHPAAPRPRLNPGFIHTGANPGSNEVRTVTIYNDGFLPMRNVTLIKPSLPWMSIVTDTNLGDIDIGANKTFDILINPPHDLEMGIYEENVTIVSSNFENVIFKIGILVTSEKTGSLKFTVKNFFGENLSNADVSIIDEDTYTVAMKNRTDPDGVAYFINIPTGRYSYKVDAQYHDEVIGNVLVDVGTKTTLVGVTAVYNFLKVDWTVVPTTVKDVYEITHNITYNTTAPIPYIKMDIVMEEVYMVPGAIYRGNVTLTNMNDIITVEDGKPVVYISNELVSVEFLVDSVPELKPHESVTIPFVVKLATHHSPTPRACDTFQFTFYFGFKDMPCPNDPSLTYSVPADIFTLNIKVTWGCRTEFA